MDPAVFWACNTIAPALTAAAAIRKRKVMFRFIPDIPELTLQLVVADLRISREQRQSVYKFCKKQAMYGRNYRQRHVLDMTH
jgi:hypothetical protein